MGEDKITFEEDYYSNGQLWYKRQFLNGKLHGEQLGYLSNNGQLSYKGQYLNGKEHGEQIGYRSNGELLYKDYYINGDEISYEEWIKYKRDIKLQRIWNKIKIK